MGSWVGAEEARRCCRETWSTHRPSGCSMWGFPPASPLPSAWVGGDGVGHSSVIYPGTSLLLLTSGEGTPGAQHHGFSPPPTSARSVPVPRGWGGAVVPLCGLHTPSPPPGQGEDLHAVAITVPCAPCPQPTMSKRRGDGHHRCCATTALHYCSHVAAAAAMALLCPVPLACSRLQESSAGVATAVVAAPCHFPTTLAVCK